MWFNRQGHALDHLKTMPLERLTVLVLPLVGDPTLVVPGLEAPRVALADDLFAIRPWSDDEDPIAITVSLLESGPVGTPSITKKL